MTVYAGCSPSKHDATAAFRCGLTVRSNTIVVGTSHVHTIGTLQLSALNAVQHHRAASNELASNELGKTETPTPQATLTCMLAQPPEPHPPPQNWPHHGEKGTTAAK